MRRQQAGLDQTAGEVRARGAASGVDFSSSSLQAYLDATSGNL
jgi:hypothetical protein